MLPSGELCEVAWNMMWEDQSFVLFSYFMLCCCLFLFAVVILLLLLLLLLLIINKRSKKNKRNGRHGETNEGVVVTKTIIIAI